MGPKIHVKIGSATAEIFAKANVAWTNVTMTVSICFKDGPRNLPLKFGQNLVSNSRDITDIEFVWVGGYAQSLSCPTIVG